MEVKAKAKYIRMSPTKVRLLTNLVKKMSVAKALEQLQFSGKLAAKPVIKLINSAVANAEHNFELAKDNLFIKEFTVNEGPTLKRWLPRAHGRATTLRKQFSHLNLILGEIKVTTGAKAKKQAIEAPVKLTGQPKKESALKIKEAVDKPEQNVETKEEGKVISDPRMEGRRGHAKLEGGSKGFAAKMFRRKSG